MRRIKDLSKVGFGCYVEIYMEGDDGLVVICGKGVIVSSVVGLFLFCFLVVER